MGRMLAVDEDKEKAYIFHSSHILTERPVRTGKIFKRALYRQEVIM